MTPETRGGHRCKVYDHDPAEIAARVAAIRNEHAMNRQDAQLIAELVSALKLVTGRLEVNDQAYYDVAIAAIAKAEAAYPPPKRPLHPLVLAAVAEAAGKTQEGISYKRA